MNRKQRELSKQNVYFKMNYIYIYIKKFIAFPAHTFDMSISQLDQWY